MTIEQYYNEKRPTPEVCNSDAGKALSLTEGHPVIGEYITIPTMMYSGLLRDGGLLDIVVRILTDNKRFKYDHDRLETLAAVLDLPYEKGGES